MAEAQGPRATRKARTREAVLAAAERVLQTRGFRRASVAEIAAEAGVSVGSVYVHFASRDQLLLAVLRAATDDEIAHARALVESLGFEAAADDLSARAMSLGGVGPAASVEHWLQQYEDEAARRLGVEDGARRRREIGDLLAMERRRRGLPAWPSGDEEVAVVLLALRAGLILQRAVDPDSVPEDLYGRAIRWILAGLDSAGESTAGSDGPRGRARPGAADRDREP